MYRDSILYTLFFFLTVRSRHDLDRSKSKGCSTAQPHNTVPPYFIDDQKEKEEEEKSDLGCKRVVSSLLVLPGR